MTHKGGKAGRRAFKKAKNVPAKLKEQVEDLSPRQLISLLKFLLVYLQAAKGMKSLSKAQRKSLAIIETQLGVRLAKSKSRSRSSKKRSKRKGNPMAARAMRLHQREGISLKAAWARVRK